ncbi:MAG: hypothetical protein KGH84_08830 [Paracoccaceae bacterium]|nr:hypothetical protein [Paracoccaceae bacterium]
MRFGFGAARERRAVRSGYAGVVPFCGVDTAIGASGTRAIKGWVFF